MPDSLGQNNDASYLGTRSPNPPKVFSGAGAPTTSYAPSGIKAADIYFDTTNLDCYFYAGKVGGNAQWKLAASTTTSPLPVSEGGTGLATITDHGVMVGSGTSAVTPLAVGTNGQVLVGATGADPAFATLASVDGTIAFTAGANTLDLSAQTSASAALRYADVTLTATEIKALAATPITLVAAPAAGNTLQFHSAILKLNYGGSNVFTEAGDNLGIKYTDASGVQVSQTIESTGFIDQAADTYTNAQPAIDAIVAASAAEAQALVLDNLGSEFGGNAADDNTLTVRVYYTLQAL